MIKVGIRADGSEQIGMGHIMRCLALAGELKKLDCQVTFLTRANNKVIELLDKKGYCVKIVPLLKKDEEVQFLYHYNQDEHLDILITDSYEFDTKYLTSLRSFIPLLVSIDDTNQCIYPSHIVVNGNLYGSELNYQSSTGDTEWLLGSKYTFLRDEFLQQDKPVVKKNVVQILVTMGGSDSEGCTPEVLKLLDEIEQEFVIQVVINRDLQI